MRCQLAMTLIAYRLGINICRLKTEYNAANHLGILSHNGVTADRIRVLHYQAEDEITRAELQPALIDDMLARVVVNPANIALQGLARLYRETLG